MNNHDKFSQSDTTHGDGIHNDNIFLASHASNSDASFLFPILHDDIK